MTLISSCEEEQVQWPCSEHHEIYGDGDMETIEAGPGEHEG